MKSRHSGYIGGYLREVAIALMLAMGMASVAAADDRGWYASLSLGATAAGGVAIDGGDNDWSTRCDRIINPNGLETLSGECDSQPPRTSWANSFDGGGGTLTALVLGYRLKNWAIEAEYAFRATAFNARSDIAIFDAVTQDKQDREIETAEGTLGKLLSHGVFGNAYWRFRNDGTATPYVGAGFGARRVSLDYGTRWKRNDDPSKITTFVDPALRAKVAGTTTIGDATHNDMVFGYQLLAGADFALNDHLRMDLKARWVNSLKFEGADIEWDQLRSHESTVGRGENILYRISTSDLGFWSLTVGFRFAL